MHNRIAGYFLCLITLASFAPEGRADDILKVHEWGTFTSFQDERGTAFKGINTDDEPVPGFVHQLFYEGRFSPTGAPPYFSKGIEQAHPEVTMRLETPVLYFHLPASRSEMTLDVSVDFHGGWLTEFFPAASASINDRAVKTLRKERLTDSSVGRLSWNGVRLGNSGEGPTTTDRVWLAPRKVAAAQVTVGEETERFLFYRGVGHRDAPLRVVRSRDSRELQLRTQMESSPGLTRIALPLSRLWLAEIRPDGTSAYRTLPAVTLNEHADQYLASTPAAFSADEFSDRKLGELKSAMHTALVKEGLFDDEATALLTTWEQSYFQSPGLRLFFLLPQVWTDEVMPLHLSAPAEVTRVMVGRIELVTPRQRELVRTITRLPLVNLKHVSSAVEKLRQSSDITEHEKYKALASGRGSPSEIGVPVPESYRAFLELGRFRTSLLLSATGERGTLPNRRLEAFVGEINAPGEGYAHHLRNQQQWDTLLAKHRDLIDQHLRTIEAEDRVHPPSQNAILFLGDSTIEKWDMVRDFPNESLIRRSTPDQLYLAEVRQFADRFAVAYRPRVVVLQAGAMDIMAGATAEEVCSDFKAFAAAIHDKLPKTRIVFIAIRPSPLHRNYLGTQTEANQLIQQLAQKDDRVSFVDGFTPLLGEDGRPRVELFGKNQFDLSEQGYKLWSELLRPILTGEALRASAAR